ncbi:MAG: hypothetical protein K2F63_01225, partial [Muribaculaceae bacterium]|nr:hypothetical protein [Muribaculaceae bacterium]
SPEKYPNLNAQKKRLRRKLELRHSLIFTQIITPKAYGFYKTQIQTVHGKGERRGSLLSDNPSATGSTNLHRYAYSGL